MPLYKMDQTVQTSAGTSIEAINQSYYSDCLQALIEALETCIDEILHHDSGKRVEFDLQNLLRLDAKTRAEISAILVGGSVKTINEARQSEGLAPVDGGDDIYMQQQNFSLKALQKREAAPPEAQNEVNQDEIHNSGRAENVGTD